MGCGEAKIAVGVSSLEFRDPTIWGHLTKLGTGEETGVLFKSKRGLTASQA